MSLKLTLAATLGLAFATPVLAQHIEVHDAYAISASTASGAAFFILHNHGDKPDHLIGAKSPAAQKVELHTHREDDAGVMRMIHVEEGFPLPAHDTVNFERGGNHVMFIGLTEPFAQGKEIPLTLIFEKSGEITVDVPVNLSHKAEGHGRGH